MAKYLKDFSFRVTPPQSIIKGSFTLRATTVAFLLRI